MRPRVLQSAARVVTGGDGQVTGRGSASPRRALALACVLASSFGVLIAVALLDPAADRPVAVSSTGSVTRQLPAIVAPAAPRSPAATTTPRPGQQLLVASASQSGVSVSATKAATARGGLTARRVKPTSTKKSPAKTGSRTPVHRSPVHRTPVSTPTHKAPTHPTPTHPTPTHSTPTHSTPTHPGWHPTSAPSSNPLAALLAARERQLQEFLRQQQAWLAAHRHYGSSIGSRTGDFHHATSPEPSLRDHSRHRS
jgi:hypothetical protein